MGSLRSRVLGWVGRRYLARQSKKGFDLEKMSSFLPDAALLPLRRDSLDPVAEIGAIRAEAPISKLDLPFGMYAWLVTGYDEAKAVLGKVTEFSTDFTNLVGNAGVTEDQNPGGLGFADPPVHTRLRKLLTPEFTMRRLNRLTPRIDEIVAEQLDAMAKTEGPVDLWQAFALPLPSLAVCDLLGVLIKEHGDEISDRELAGLADGVLTGGLETTASMLALGALVLLRDEKAFEAVRGDEQSVHRFVEELLRYLTVVQMAFPRFAKEDMEIGGVRISEGDIVLVSLSAADRDPKLGADMEKFDAAREPTSHLAFSYGIHRCIGAELARMELRTAYPA